MWSWNQTRFWKPSATQRPWEIITVVDLYVSILIFIDFPTSWTRARWKKILDTFSGKICWDAVRLGRSAERWQDLEFSFGKVEGDVSQSRRAKFPYILSAGDRRQSGDERWVYLTWKKVKLSAKNNNKTFKFYSGIWINGSRLLSISELRWQS